MRRCTRGTRTARHQRERTVSLLCALPSRASCPIGHSHKRRTQHMKHSDLIAVAARLMSAGETFAVLGEPGIGKTESVVTAAEIALGLRQPGQLGALPKRSDSIIITHPV